MTEIQEGGAYTAALEANLGDLETELREAKWGDRYAIIEAIELLEASHLTRALLVLRGALDG